MVKFTTSVIDSKINSLLLSLNLKLSAVKEPTKPTSVAATDAGTATTLEKSVSKQETSLKQQIKPEIIKDEDLPPLKPTPLKRTVSNMSETNFSVSKKQKPNEPYVDQGRDRSEPHSVPRNKPHERSITPKGN